MKEIFKEYKVRVFWLIIGLLGSMLIARVIFSFEEILKEHLLIASFIPLVVYLSDAVGAQMESIIIRTISQENTKFKLREFFSRQALTTLFVAITVSLAAGVFTYFAFSNMQVSIVVAAGLFFGCLSSLLTGLLVPYYFWKFHQDPAEASGPIAAVIQDFISVSIYFTVASLVL